MSAEFIIEYAGAPIRFVAGQPEITDQSLASKYSNEADAWYAAYQHNLNPDRCKVVDRYSLNIARGGTPLSGGEIKQPLTAETPTVSACAAGK